MFHFANGSASDSKLVVWKIPIYLKGFYGEVYSAEVPDGTTPLLLSIASMSALDMVIRLKDQVVEVHTLGIRLPLMTTKTNHLAIFVAFDADETQQPTKLHEPRAVSEKEDLLVYYNEELCFSVLADLPLPPEEPCFSSSKAAPCLVPRTIKTGDPCGQLSKRRVQELAASVQHIREQDVRTWAALKRRYTRAEQHATVDFQNTVVFEPFGGNFGVTRLAAAEFGWTNSQPLDLLDGYDLLSSRGEGLLWTVLHERKPYLVLIAFDCRIWSLLTNLSPSRNWEQLRSTLDRRTLMLIARICFFQHFQGRYLENPLGSMAWVWQGILKRLTSITKFCAGDQCRYGLKDRENRCPIQKPTGWYFLGKRCQCKWGSHQQLIGHNRFGLRSKLAASYPKELRRAICRGILRIFCRGRWT